jgi:N-acetylmuramic acid 6-phosphate (MurNAc-6-P) etherase
MPARALVYWQTRTGSERRLYVEDEGGEPRTFGSSEQRVVGIRAGERLKRRRGQKIRGEKDKKKDGRKEKV